MAKRKNLSAAAKRLGMRIIGKTEATKRQLSKSHTYVDYDGLVIPYNKALKMAKDMELMLRNKEQGIKPLTQVVKSIKAFFTSEKPSFKNLGISKWGNSDKKLFSELAVNNPWLNDKKVSLEAKRKFMASVDSIRTANRLNAGKIDVVNAEKYIGLIHYHRDMGNQQGNILSPAEFEALNTSFKNLGLTPEQIKALKESLISPPA